MNSRQGVGSASTGHLHHLVIAREPVDEAQRFGMDQVLGVVRDQNFESNPMPPLERLHAPVDPIQAIAFGGRAVVRADSQVYVRIARCAASATARSVNASFG